MNFGLHTLFALVNGIALLCVIVRQPQIAFFVLTFGLGLPIFVIGLTAPQVGTRLHVESRPLVLPLMKVWVIVFFGVVFLALIDMLFPSLRCDLRLPRARPWL
jgi:hypothetical protein